MDALAIADIRLGMGGSGAFKAEIDAIRGAMLSDVWSCDMKDAAGMKREVLGIAARYGYKVEEGTP